MFISYRTFRGKKPSVIRNHKLVFSQYQCEAGSSNTHKKQDFRIGKLSKSTKPLQQKHTQRIEDFMMEEVGQNFIIDREKKFLPREVSNVLNNQDQIRAEDYGMRGLHEQATKILDKGQLEQAKQLFTLGNQRYPGNEYFLNSLGVVEGKLKNFQKARKFINMAIDAEPRSSPAHQSLGVIEYRCGNYGAAIDCFRNAIKYDKKNLAAYQAWGILEGEQGNVDVARRLFSKALSIFDRHLQSLNAWAQLEWKLENYEQATTLVDRVLQINSKDQEASIIKAKLLWRSLEFEKSRELLQYFIEEDVNNSIIRCLSGDLERQIGNTILARQHYHKALKGDENNLHAWVGLQQLELQNGNYAITGNLLNAALQRFPENLLLQHRLGQYFVEIGKYKQAAKILLLRLSQTPQDGVVLNTLGRMYQKMEDFESANHYFTLGKCVPNIKEALPNYESLAEIAAAGGQIMVADAIYNEGGQLGQTTPRFLLNWALHKKHQNNLVESQKLMRQAVSMDPLQVKIWQNLGLVEKRLGNINAALDCFVTALNIRPWDEILWHSYCSTLLYVDIVQARGALEQACNSVIQNGALLMLWGLMEWDNGDEKQARQIFQRGNVQDLRDGHPPLYEAWAQLERSLGNNSKSDQLLQEAENIRQFQEIKRKNQISQLQSLNLQNLENQIQQQLFYESNI